MHPNQQPAPAPRSALLRGAVLAVAGLAVAVFCLKAGLLLWQSSLSSETDLGAYMSGAQRLRAGLPLYPPDLDITRSRLQYAYPPLLAQLLYPFESYTLVWWAWAAVSLACWGAALRLLLGQVLPSPAGQALRRSDWWPVFLAALVNFPPVLVHLTWGQLQLPLLLILTGAWLELRRGRETRAGLLVGLAITLKVFPLLLLLPLALQRRWRCAAAALLLSGAALGLSFAAVGPQQVAFYITRVLPEINRQEILTDNYAITQTLRLALGPGFPAGPAGLALRLAGLALLAWLALRPGTPADQALAAGVTATLWLSPIVWAHYFVLAYLPCADLLLRAGRRRRAALALAYFGIATASLLFYVPEPAIWAAQALPVLGTGLLLALQCAPPPPTGRVYTGTQSVVEYPD